MVLGQKSCKNEQFINSLFKNNEPTLSLDPLNNESNNKYKKYFTSK